MGRRLTLFLSCIADLTLGQVVINYIVEFQSTPNGSWQPFSNGTTIGSKRIDIASAAVQASALRLTITSAFSSVLPVTLNAFSPVGCSTA